MRLSLSRVRRRPGFALIATLALMVLILLLSIGLLTLSSISVRQTAGAQELAAARANARLALMLAVGELQKSAGPDQAITAASDLVTGDSGRRHLTGAWKSWDINPQAGVPDYKGEKEKRFQRWLVSDADEAATRSPSYPSQPAPADPVEMIAGEKDEVVYAGRVQIPSNRGAYAWHVADESVKARVDLARNPEAKTLAQRQSLLAGHRSGLRGLTRGEGDFGFLPADDTPDAYRDAQTVHGKLADLMQTDLLAEDRIAREFTHDLTTSSLGLLTDVRKGGLKRDLTCSFESKAGLPQDLAGRRLYQSTLGFDGVSDPYWSALSGYYNFYKNLKLAGDLPSYKLENADPVQLERHVVPRNYSVAPVVAKIEILFTFVVRDTHGPWVAQVPSASKDTNKKYMMHMVYVPLVTLHNPYNVELEFERMNLTVRDVPVAFNFYVNGKPQNNRLVPFNEMFVVNNEGGGDYSGAKGERAIVLDLAEWTSPSQTRPSQTLKMAPGQTLVCGPYLNPAAGSADTLRGSVGTQEAVEAASGSAIKLRPGFSGKAVGLSVDWLTPPPFNSGQSTDGNLGVLGLRLDDKVRIESAIRRPLRGVQDRWEVDASLVLKSKKQSYGGMRFDYKDEATLLKYFDKVYTYPVDGDLTASELYEPYSKALASQTRSQAAAVLSTAMRTCNGGVFETNLRDPQAGALNELRDGKLAGKPFLHHNPARASVMVDLKADPQGRFTHELNFQPLKGEVDDVLELDSRDRGAAITGNTTVAGIKSGALFDLPAGPLQTIAGFRRSNALSSTYLPNFLQPVASSAVSPLMDTSKVRQSGLASYDLLDHSWLANHALYDSFYFSTARAADGEPAAERFASFLRGAEPLDNQCYGGWMPSGRTAEEISAKLFPGSEASADAWQKIAAYQMVKGAFNVNSTSELAWKAMLSSLRDTPLPVLWASSLQPEYLKEKGAPVTGLSMPLAGLASRANPDPLKIDNKRTNEWNGFRTLNSKELDELAKRIVEEVRSRGPFLSMSEFVNRRLGSNDEMTRGGALHVALEKSKVNDAVFGDMVPVQEKDVADPLVYNYATPQAATGNPAEGAPGWISQGDLLQILEPRATVRGDTFIIRACGQALDDKGKVVARAYAEAVVQRTPAFVDAAAAPETAMADLTEANRRFGRSFRIVSFRWVQPKELS